MRLFITFPTIFIQYQSLFIIVIVCVELSVSHCILLSIIVRSSINVSNSDPRVIGLTLSTTNASHPPMLSQISTHPNIIPSVQEICSCPESGHIPALRWVLLVKSYLPASILNGLDSA